MKKTRSVLVATAFAGLLLGSATSLTSCASTPSATEMQIDKHACKGLNACKNQGGCKAGDQGCAGKNSCKQKGGCAVPVAH